MRPWYRKVSPGASSVPASSEPTITVDAPAASALAMSPLVRMPPSAITGTPLLAAAAAAAMIAVSCGTPTPATIRVVQIEPGPMPTLIASAPASISALAASAVATLPATTWTELDSVFTRSTARGDVDVVAVRGVDDDAVAAGVDQRLGALEARVADGGRRGDPQPPFGILGRERRGDRFLDVLDGDQPDAVIVVVDHQQFLDPPLVEDAPRFLLAGAERHRREIVLGHQLADRLAAGSRRSGRRGW